MNRSLTFLQWNAQGMNPHGPDFYNNIFQKKILHILPDIICIQETWFHSYNIFDIPQYFKVIKNRGEKGRGGLAVYINKEITFKEITTPINEEYQKINIYLKDKKFTLINFYNPCTTIPLDLLNSMLDNCLEEIIIVGDFNSHNRFWGSKKTDANGKKIEDFIEQNNLVLLNDGAGTRLNPQNGSKSCIDLTISTKQFATKSEWEVLPNLFGSDHFVISITYNVFHENCRNSDKVKIDPKWSCHGVDWNLYKHQILESLRNLPYTQQGCHTKDTNNNNNIQLQYDFLISSIYEAADKTMKKVKIKRVGQNPIPWWTKECEEAIKSRNRAKNRLGRTLDLNDLIDYKKKKALAQKTIRQAKHFYWAGYVRKLNRFSNLKETWRKIKEVKSSEDNSKLFPNLLDKDNNSVTNTQDKADLIGNYFKSVDNRLNDEELQKRTAFENEIIDKELETTSNTNDCLNENFTFKELDSAIKDMKNSAPGADKIKPLMIKKIYQQKQSGIS